MKTSTALAPVAGARQIYTLADRLVGYLTQLEIDAVFGVPGGAIEPFYDAVARHRRDGGNIRSYVARHEAGGAFMADGYTRETGKIGVVVSTSGPGGTNLLTAVASAYSNNVPMLVITGQPALHSFGRWTLQESSCTGIDLVSIFARCTRYSDLVTHPEQLEAKLRAAIHAAKTMAGPVHLSFPADVFRAESVPIVPTMDLDEITRVTPVKDVAGIASLNSLLATCRRPVIVVGAGCSQAINSIMGYVMRNGIRFVSTPEGKGLINPDHPLYDGVLGAGGHATARLAVEDSEVDLIIAAGADINECTSPGLRPEVLSSKLVHVSSVDERMVLTPHAHLRIRGDVETVFDSLDQTMAFTRSAITGRHWGGADMVEAPAAWARDSVPLKPQRVMRELGRLFHGHEVFLADAGSSEAWAVHYLHPARAHLYQVADHHQPAWLRIAPRFPSLGWAIGAAVGTAAANTGTRAICITTGASMLLSGQELSVAVADGLDVVFIVLNDGQRGAEAFPRRRGNVKDPAFVPPAIDFAAMARAQGARGFTIRSVADLQAEEVAQACCAKGPTLLDVYIDPCEPVPAAQLPDVIAPI